MSRQAIVNIIPALFVISVLGCGGADSDAKKDAKDPVTDWTKTKDWSGGPGETTPLIELLDKLPKDRRPRDVSDTLRYEQATAWLKDNVVGKHASFDKVKPRSFKFKSEGSGRYTATGFYDQSTGLYGLSPFYMRLADFDDGGKYDVGFTLSGLSEKAAENLRSWPEGNPFELTFKIKSARLSTNGAAAEMVLGIGDLAIKGLE